MVNEQQDNWDLFIEQACWGIRSSYNESTKHTPYEVMCIRKPRFPSHVGSVMTITAEYLFVL